MSPNVILLYKNMGETPLEALERLRLSRAEYKDLPMTYAGRLDPLAEGLLLALIGDECNKKDEYLGLSKEYELTILFGFETDTYDLLGLVETPSKESQTQVLGSPFQKLYIETAQPDHSSDLSSDSVQAELQNFLGDIEQEYPPYSSKPVQGKPLFQWAREGRLDEIEIPKHTVHIESIKILETKIISKKELEEYINKVVPLVKGDFRQDEILSKWQETLESVSCPNSFPLLKLRVSSGSGAYMRVLAHDLGLSLNYPALAYHIKRTKIGEWSI